jgi:hypothetical protein
MIAQFQFVTQSRFPEVLKPDDMENSFSAIQAIFRKHRRRGQQANSSIRGNFKAINFEKRLQETSHWGKIKKRKNSYLDICPL